MKHSFVYATPASSVTGANITDTHKLPRKQFVAADGTPLVVQEGDRILLTVSRNGRFECIEPVALQVVSSDKQSFQVKVDKAYVAAVSLDQVHAIINRGLSNGANPLSEEEYSAIVALMGNAKLEEGELLTHVRSYIAARGYYFDDETVYNYHCCLKTRPFVILAGLSGTGKSKLSQLYAEALGHTVQNEHYLRLAVRPSWNDDRFLLGYLNSITGEYVTEPAIDFVMQAEADRDNLYFFCLDEMNLAHVEHYFSQFLSALEEENAADRRIPLISRATLERLAKQGKPIEHDRVVIVPPNLLFTGTINVDETTQPLSDKVIDRANTIEFFDVDLDKVPERKPPPDAVHISAPVWRSYIAQQPDTSYRSHIVEIARILNRGGLGLGYRVLREIEHYLANSQALLSREAAFDLQVKQRILPRVRGTRTIQPMLQELMAYAKQTGLPRSLKRLEEMDKRLRADGYTSFWR